MKKNIVLIFGIAFGSILSGVVFWEYAYHPLYKALYLYDGYLPRTEVRAVVTGKADESGAVYHISGDLDPRTFATAMKHFGVAEMLILWERESDSGLRAVGVPIFPRMYLHNDGSATFPQGVQYNKGQEGSIFRFLSELP